MTRTPPPIDLDDFRFPTDPWRFVEAEFSTKDLGLTETLFAVGNGYIGMRANPEEGREAHSHGTFLNGFHETWPIQHAEAAYGFATTGQTIVNVPDAKVMKIYVDDEPLLLADAELDDYQRVLDFRAGKLIRSFVWRTPGGHRVRVHSERLVSFAYRHLAIASVTIEVLDGPAPVMISSQLLNRQDGGDEYYVRSAALGEGLDPRRAPRFSHRVLIPEIQVEDGDDVVLGYRCANSGMTVATASRHVIDFDGDVHVYRKVSEDRAKTVYSFDLTLGQPFTMTKLISYHSSRGVPARELADRCRRTIHRAALIGADGIRAAQREWLDDYWHRSDIVVEGSEREQQAIRWNLFQLAQATGRTQEQGIAAKGVTADGYEGHYFWDTEVYVLPFLAATSPEIARKILRFRWRLLPLARERAKMMSQRGALYAWRTINGEEASAYYAAGTAQYHINAAVAFAIERYMRATGDDDFLADEGAEILIETARLWEDLGFYVHNGERRRFHIHGVTGPDEYTTVVNDNLYTNVMARFNLSYAAETVTRFSQENPTAFTRVQRRTGLDLAEVDKWRQAAHAMYIPYNTELGIHPQEAAFLDREPWDFANTPPENYPLLLNYHPLVIYRHQVTKQADVVLAMYLQGDLFTPEEKKRNFDYYDPITTGDSSLSACVQSIVASHINYRDLGKHYFQQALFVDLANTHGNTADGVHIASAGGMWAAIAHGFARTRFDHDALRFDHALPPHWSSLRFRITRFGTMVEITLEADGSITVEGIEGPALPVARHGQPPTKIAAGDKVTL